MGILYIVSAEEAAGKTAICAGLARNYLNDGKKVGYLKPQAADKDSPDNDIDFMKQMLGIADVVNAPDVIQGRDIVFVEAKLGANPGDSVSIGTYGAVKEMKARAIAVESYTSQPSGFTDVYKGFGESFLGVIVNKVPESQLQRVRDEVIARFNAAGIQVLGVIPESRVLLAITVSELAESIRGEILNNADKSGELVENFMLGAMVVDSGLDYFARKTNKAALMRQDRPDMQLAALETPTKCLVLCGSTEKPLYNVLQKAESRGIPIIATETVTNDVVSIIEDTLLGTRLNQEMKLSRLAEIIKQNLDINSVV